MTEVSRYFSEDGQLEAAVFIEDSNYIVKFYVDGQQVCENKDLIGKSEYYAEEVAENYVLGILKINLAS